MNPNILPCIHPSQKDEVFSTYFQSVIHMYYFHILKCSNFFLCLSKGAFRRRQWHPTPVLLPAKSHGQRSLVGRSPRGRKESNMTERIHFTSLQYDYGSLLFTKLCVYKNFGSCSSPVRLSDWSRGSWISL